MSTERQIWEKGYARGTFSHIGGDRIWALPDNRQVKLPGDGVPLYYIRESPFYVGKIDEVIAAAFRLGVEIERV